MRALSLALLLPLAWGCDRADPEPTINIPASWQQQRKGVGHVTHLGQGVKCRDCHPLEGSGFGRPSLIVCDDCHQQTDAAHEGDCYACHAFAEKTEVAEGNCARCHDEPRIHDEEDCLKCHSRHGEPPPPSCVSCHEDQPANLHRDCSGCHPGHEPKTKVAETCDGCHAAQQPARLPGHDCDSCHVAHGPEKTCASCHGAIKKDRHACTSCHASHQPEVVACASCHSDVLVDHGAGRADCAACHVPHRSAPIGCAKCHEEVPKKGALHAPGMRCVQCHVSHAFVQETCEERCHAIEVAPGHDECAKCHLKAAHAPRAVKGCQDCHQTKVSPGHRDCAGCHQVHTGASTGKTCASCHPRKPKDQHRTLDCSKCHQDHDPRTSTCGGCHSSLPGLHRNSDHRTCAECHQAHAEETVRGRALCDRCHQLPDHEPTVATCLGCHAFGGGVTKR